MSSQIARWECCKLAMELTVTIGPLKSQSIKELNFWEKEMALSFSDSNFDSEVLQSNVPVVVDFWAPWCGPCKLVGPVIDQLANENEGVKIGKLNVDESGEIAERYGISSIPAILLFKNGQVVDSVVGAQPKAALQKMIDRNK